MADAGMTFSPLNTQPGQTPGRGPNTVQDAIKLLSFRLPENGASASPLLGPQTALGGQPQNWLIQLLHGLIQNPGGLPPGGARASVQMHAPPPQSQGGAFQGGMPPAVGAGQPGYQNGGFNPGPYQAPTGPMGHAAFRPVPQIPGGYQPFPGGYPMGGAGH